MTDETKLIQLALHDTDILLVEDDSVTRTVLRRMFEQLGARVHEAGGQMEALGMYIKLFQARRIPRIVVADWWLVPKGGPEYQFLSTINSGRNITSIMLLETVCKLDEHAFVLCYTNAPEDASPHITKLRTTTNTADVVNKSKVSPVEFVESIVDHPGITKQRLERDRLRRLLSEVAHEAEDGSGTRILKVVSHKLNS
jgi:hypothetical protein